MASPPVPDTAARRRPWTVLRRPPSAAAALWAIAGVLWSYRVDAVWNLPGLGFDLKPVRDAGVALSQGSAVYSIPAFVYPPSAALLVGRPLSFLGLTAERQAATIVVALLIVGAAVLGTRAMGRPWFGAAAAGAVLGAGLIGWVRYELVLENLSVLVAFGAGAAMLAWVRGRDVLAGSLLGLTLAIKPMLAVFLVGLVVLRRWRALAAALAVPLVLNLLVLAFDTAAFDGLRGQISYILSGHGSSFDQMNGALVAIGRVLGIPTGLSISLRVLVGAAALGSILFVWRRRPEPARSLEAAGIALAGLFLVSNLFENHFVFVLVPFACACVEARSPFRWWPVAALASLAAAFVSIGAGPTGLTPDDVLSAQRGLALAAAVLAVAVALLCAPAEAVAGVENDGLTKIISSSRLPDSTPAEVEEHHE